MIGVTAVASAFVYYGRGEVLPVVTADGGPRRLHRFKAGLVLAERTHSTILRESSRC